MKQFDQSQCNFKGECDTVPYINVIEGEPPNAESDSSDIEGVGSESDEASIDEKHEASRIKLIITII